jgi:peptidoglycan hydrolase-like protein with peptidoglycan-binding domain
MTDINSQSASRNIQLKQGARGQLVKELQKLLYEYGAYALDYNYGLPEAFIDGVFGSDTKGAVEAFQAQVFLKVDGIVGYLTWQALYKGSSVNMPLLKKGATGELVILVQMRLTIAGDYKGLIDGDFGITTENAVKTLQKRTGLTVDGQIGDRTWYELTRIFTTEGC